MNLKYLMFSKNASQEEYTHYVYFLKVKKKQSNMLKMQSCKEREELINTKLRKLLCICGLFVSL